MFATIIRPLLKGIKRNGPLSRNGFARRLAEYLIANRKIPDNSTLLGLLYRTDSPVHLDYKRTNKIPDRRIRNLFLKDIRQYSLSRNNEADADYYALDFNIDGQIASAIIQGANGTGKTTLFSSLEFLYQGYSEIASAHGHSNAQIQNFFRSVGVPLTNVQINAIFFKEEEIKNNRVEGFELPAAFCSECDYFEITRNWKDVDHYIANQLGYWEMLKIHKQMATLTNLLKIAYRFSTVTKDIAKLSSVIKNASDSNSEKTKVLKNTRDSLKALLEIIRKEYYEARGPEFKRGIKDILKDSNGEELDTQRLQEVQQTFDYIDSIWRKLLYDFARTARPIFEKMINEYLFKESEKFSMEVENGIFKFNLFVFGDEDPKNPIEYFNTFRLKLFCVAFKMSLFCYAKKLHRINLPFVVDDIFDSSDFHHRTNIGAFIWHMLEAHDEAIKSDAKAEYPLQLLFFTQDNIIAENVYRGMSDYIFEKDQETEMKVKYGRLFRPCDARICDKECHTKDEDGHQPKDEHIKEVELKGKRIKVIPLVDYYCHTR